MLGVKDRPSLPTEMICFVRMLLAVTGLAIARMDSRIVRMLKRYILNSRDLKYCGRFLEIMKMLWNIEMEFERKQRNYTHIKREPIFENDSLLEFAMHYSLIELQTA